MPRVVLVVVFVLVFGGLVGTLVYSQHREAPLQISGFVEADEIRVGSRVGGRVAKVHVEEGQVVTRGIVLFELEPFDLLAARARARAERDAAASEHERLQSGLRPAEIAQARARRDELASKLAELEAGPREEEIATARARVRQADAQLELAKQTHSRTSILVQTAGTSQAELDRATENLHDSEAAVDVRKQELALLLAGTRKEALAAARAALQQAEAALALAKDGFRIEDIAQAKAKLAASDAEIERITDMIAELTVEAPVDGTIEAVDLQRGDLVGANAPVMSLMDTSHLWIRAYVPENRLGFPIGHAVDVTVDAFPGKRFGGHITFVSRQAEFTPGNVQTPEERSKQVFRIKVSIDDGGKQLRPGMSADVWLEPRADDPGK